MFGMRVLQMLLPGKQQELQLLVRSAFTFPSLLTAFPQSTRVFCILAQARARDAAAGGPAYP